jgi:hypothetical protein
VITVVDQGGMVISGYQTASSKNLRFFKPRSVCQFSPKNQGLIVQKSGFCNLKFSFLNLGWFVDAVHPEGFAGQAEENELAAGTERRDLPRHTPLLAEDGSTFHPSAWRRQLEPTGHRAREVKCRPVSPPIEFASSLRCYSDPEFGGGQGAGRSVFCRGDGP